MELKSTPPPPPPSQRPPSNKITSFNWGNWNPKWNEPKIKEMITGIGGILIIVLILYFSCGDKKKRETIIPLSVSSYLSARQLKISLEKSGIDLSDYADLDTMERLTENNISLYRHCFVFYRNDTILNAELSIFFKENRDNIKKHYGDFLPFVEAFDTSAVSWIKENFSVFDLKKDLEIDKSFGNVSFSIAYYPNADQDVLNISIEPLKRQ